MLKISRDLALLAATAILHSVASAATPLPSPPEVSAEAYLVADFNSGTTLAEKEPDRRVEPASITKVMTSYVVFKELEAGNLTLEDQVTISENAWRRSMRTSRTFLEPRTQAPVLRQAPYLASRPARAEPALPRHAGYHPGARLGGRGGAGRGDPGAGPVSQ